MTISEVRDGVIECLRDLVRDRDVPDITDKTDPIADLGLDSEDGVELACALSSRLRFHVPDEVNPLVDDVRHRGRRVGEIVQLIAGLAAAVAS